MSGDVSGAGGWQLTLGVIGKMDNDPMRWSTLIVRDQPGATSCIRRSRISNVAVVMPAYAMYKKHRDDNIVAAITKGRGKAAKDYRSNEYHLNYTEAALFGLGPLKGGHLGSKMGRAECFKRSLSGARVKVDCFKRTYRIPKRK